MYINSNKSYAPTPRFNNKEKWKKVPNNNENIELIQQPIEDNKNMKVLKTKITLGREKVTKMRNHEGIIVTKKKDIFKVIEKCFTKSYKSYHTSKPLNPGKIITNVKFEEMSDILNEEMGLALGQMKNVKYPQVKID